MTTVQPATLTRMLSDNGRRRIYRLMAFFAHCDGELAPAERQVLDRYRHLLDLPAEEARTLEAEGAATKMMKFGRRPVEREILMRCVAEMVAADGRWHEREQERVRQLCQRLLIPPLRMQRLLKRAFRSPESAWGEESQGVAQAPPATTEEQGMEALPSEQAAQESPAGTGTESEAEAPPTAPEDEPDDDLAGLLCTVAAFDLPEPRVSFDLDEHLAPGGDCGFVGVYPGLHHIGCRDRDGVLGGLWVIVRPGALTAVRQDPTDGTWRLIDSEAARRLIGRLGAAEVVDVNPEDAERPELSWAVLSSRIDLEHFPPALHGNEREIDGDCSFDDLDATQGRSQGGLLATALEGTHGSRHADFLAELQWAFLRLLVDQDEQATRRWRWLFLAATHATAAMVDRHADLFPALVWTLTAQLNRFDGHRLRGDVLIARSSYVLAERLLDSAARLARLDLLELAEHWARHLRERGLKPPWAPGDAYYENLLSA